MDNEAARSILRAAKENGYLGVGKKPDICLINYINTANQFFNLLELSGEQGLDTNQLTKRLGLNKNTVRGYTRILEDLGLISAILPVNKQAGENKVFYLKMLDSSQKTSKKFS